MFSIIRIEIGTTTVDFIQYYNPFATPLLHSVYMLSIRYF